MISRAFILSLILLVISSSKSFTDELKPLRIVITPSRIVQDISKTNSFISVITEEDIKNSSATNIIELLNANTSLGIASTGGAGSIPSYFLRGFAKKYLKVTVQNVSCTKIMSKLARSYSDKHGLKDLVKEFTGNEISKNLQSSDFGGELSEKQLQYCAKDVIFLNEIYVKLKKILIREKRDDLYENSIKFIYSRVDLDVASFNSDIWSH